MTAPKTSAEKCAKQANEEEPESPIVACLVPAGRASFPLYELSRIFRVSVVQLWNLIEDGTIAVPKENIDRAKSRAAIQVPRASIVDFVRRRSSRNLRRGRKKAQRKKTVRRKKHAAR